MCLSADWTGAPPSPPVFVSTCHTKVLICSARTELSYVFLRWPFADSSTWEVRLGVVVVLLLFALVAWVLAVWPALSGFPPFPFPLVVFWCFLVQSVVCWSSGYLVVSTTVRLTYRWHGVSWLIGSCLHSASWQQRLRPCVGLCPLHHVVGAVHVPLALALRYSPLGDPEYP